MNTSKLTFVILLPYISQTITDLYTFGLKILENESDLELGYFTVEGENQSIKEFKSFLSGSNFI